MEFTIKDMSCGHCVSVITKTVQQLDAQARVQVELTSKKVVVESSQPRAAIAEALADAGYPAS